MSKRPGGKWRRPLLIALLLPVSVAAHALGVATPEVMSGFNAPLKARVALLNTGDLHADDIRVSLADSARWQAMNVPRSADTDTLHLAVEGHPGHLYLELRGSRPLVAPWLDVVVTLRWPQGELTPQLTLLPATVNDQTPMAPAPWSGTSSREIPASDVGRERPDTHGALSEVREGATAAPDSARMAALETRIAQLEQQLRDTREAQAALISDLAAFKEQPSEQAPPDVADVQALTRRQQTLENRLDQLEQNRASTNVAPSEPVAASSTSAPEGSSREAAASVPEPAVFGRDQGFVWTWLLAALLLVLAGAWAGLRRWRQQRYRLVSVTELASSEEAGVGHQGAQAVGEAGSEHATSGRHVPDEVWTAQRAQIEAICNEAEIFHRHHRHEHAITMLSEGLAHYPNDLRLMRALAAMKAARDREDNQKECDEAPQGRPVSASRDDDLPELAPAWSLADLSENAGAAGEGPTSHVSPTFCEPDGSLEGRSSVSFPGSWALEEVAFGGFDADNERPDADRLSRHA